MIIHLAAQISFIFFRLYSQSVLCTEHILSRSCMLIASNFSKNRHGVMLKFADKRD